MDRDISIPLYPCQALRPWDELAIPKLVLVRSMRRSEVVVVRPAKSGSSSLHLVSSEPFEIDCADIAGAAK